MCDFKLKVIKSVYQFGLEQSKKIRNIPIPKFISNMNKISPSVHKIIPVELKTVPTNKWEMINQATDKITITKVAGMIVISGLLINNIVIETEKSGLEKRLEISEATKNFWKDQAMVSSPKVEKYDDIFLENRYLKENVKNLELENKNLELENIELKKPLQKSSWPKFISNMNKISPSVHKIILVELKTVPTNKWEMINQATNTITITKIASVIVISGLVINSIVIETQKSGLEKKLEISEATKDFWKDQAMVSSPKVQKYDDTFLESIQLRKQVKDLKLENAELKKRLEKPWWRIFF